MLLTLLASAALLALSLLPLLSLLALLTLLPFLLLLLLGKLLHLLAKLFSLAPQHLLLPALLERLLLALILLLGELLLAALPAAPWLLQSLVDYPSAAARPKRSSRQDFWPGLVLILPRVSELKIEHAGEIASGALRSTAATAALLAEGNLNIAERGFGAQQVLQRALLGSKSVLSALVFQLIRSAGPISSAAASRSFTKFWNS